MLNYDDLLQAARIGLHLADQTFSEEHNVKFITYAYKCASSSVQKHLRANRGIIRVPYKAKYDAENTSLCIVVGDLLEAMVMADDLIASSELKMVLTESLSSLTEKQRAAVQSVYFEQQSLEDVADAMGISKQRVHQMLTVSLEKMRKSFEENGLDLSDMIKN